jgi:hypothetical protein
VVPGDGTPFILASIAYNTSNGQGDIEFGSSGVGDTAGTPLTDCVNFGECLGANVTIGGAVDTPTPTSTPTPVTPTATPCTPGQPGCATATSQAFVTITPTPGGETATPVPGGGEPTTAPPGGGSTPPTGGGAPGGGAAPGGAGPIRLPDTGDGSGGFSWSGMSLIGLAALAAGALAGGTYYYAARRVTARGRDQ